MDAIPFQKMHGLGNDFVVIDARARPLAVSAAAARAIGDRHLGVGFDQLIVIEPPRSAEADLFIRFLNADGSEAGACGNATRCVAAGALAQTGRDALVIETISGLLPAWRAADGEITVDMGTPGLGWQDVPLARPIDTLAVPIGTGGLGDATCCSMGNPHATFFVADLGAIDVPALGALLEHHPIFPARANIGFAEVLSPEHIRLQVWERGAGLTLACGSGACATLVAAVRRGLTGRRCEILVRHGRLVIEWRADGHVLMTGPVATSFSGALDAALFAPA